MYVKLFKQRGAFKQTHRMHNAESEPLSKLWALGDNDVSM